MSEEQFRSVMPDAVFTSQKTVEGHPVNAYSLKVAQPYNVRGEDMILTSHDEAWFYFRDGQFVKWGKPNEWP